MGRQRMDSGVRPGARRCFLPHGRIGTNRLGSGRIGTGRIGTGRIGTGRIERRPLTAMQRGDALKILQESFADAGRSGGDRNRGECCECLRRRYCALRAVRAVLGVPYHPLADR